MRHFTLLFILFLCTCVRAQTSDQAPSSPPNFDFPEGGTRVYPLSAKLVDRLLDPSNFNPLPELSAPYPVGYAEEKLPPGHFLRMHLKKDQLRYTYFSTYKYTVSATAAKGKFQLLLHDPAGNHRTDATITADGKTVRYSAKHRAYRRRDWRIDVLKIVVDTDTLFYEVQEEIDRSRISHDLKNLGRKQPILTLRRPYFYGKSIYRTFKDGIGRGYWHWPHNYPLKNTLHKIFHPAPVTGYVVTNQPRYRPGDTLKVSAYLANPKGRPLGKDSLRMVISSYEGSKNHRFETLVGGAEKGRYTHTMALPVDWPLDQTYRVAFSIPGSGRGISPSISFTLQDYELAEYALTTAVSTDCKLPGSAWIDVNTEDINGLALPNGEIKVSVILDQFEASNVPETLLLPDTLFVRTEATDSRKDRRIVLPDNLFPAGHSLKIRIKTQLTGPSGEYQEAENKMTVDRRYEYVPKLSVRGDSLLAFLTPDQPVEAARQIAVLQTIDLANDTLSRTVSLPLSILIDHHQVKYRLLYGEQTDNQELAHLHPGAGTPAYWSRDTLVLRFPNAHGQPLRWSLSEGNDIIRSQPSETDNNASPHAPENAHFVRSGFAPGAQLQFNYSYLAGGKWWHKQHTLTAPEYNLLTEHKNILDLELTQPAKVKPGETVRISVRATDQRGKPAGGVRLSAGTFNARFGKNPVTTPTYLKRIKRRRERQNYHTRDLKLHRETSPPFWLIEDFGLDTALAYKLRYPTPEFRYERDLDTLLPAGIEKAHFAPFVVRGNKLETVLTVYVDNRLVYWYHPNIRTPYSIPVPHGLREVIIRTHWYRYTKKINFNGCRQLVLSFDARRWAAAGWTRKKMEEWDSGETMNIHDRVFALSHMDSRKIFHYKRIPNGEVQSGEYNRYADWTPLGLASSRQQIRFFFPEGDSVDLRFEPHATYRIDRGRDRLYPLKKEAISKSLNRLMRNGPQVPGLPRYRYQPPVPPPKRSYLKLAEHLPRLARSATAARLQFAHIPHELRSIVLSPREYEDHYYASMEVPNRLAPGVYDVLFHFRNDSVFHQVVTLVADSLLLVNFNQDSTSFYSNFQRLSGYSAPKPVEEIPESLNLTFSGDSISGIVLDTAGLPMIGASVFIVGSGTGSVAGYDGKFSLAVPDGPFTLEVNYVGFADKKLIFGNGELPFDPITIIVEPGTERLDEVVVTAYSIPLIEMDRTTSGQTLTSEEIRNLPTRNISQITGIAAGVSVNDDGDAINIRGSRSNALDYYVDGVRVGSPGAAPSLKIRGISSMVGSSPIYIVDGVALKNIPQLTDEQIASIEVLHDPAMTAVYGAQGANGVVVITTSGNPAGTVTGALPPVDLRESFSDYASFIPAFRTDAEGRAAFDVTFPDDITAWNTFAVGQDRRRRIGFALERTQSFLPFQAQLYLPRFLVEGDETEAATLAINRTGEARNVRTTFSGGQQGARTQDAVLVGGSEARYPFSVTTGEDSLRYQFSVQTLDGEQEADGEERTVRIYPKGTETISGELLMLNEKINSLSEAFIRQERGPVTLCLPGNRVDQLLNDLDHIVDYPYGCAEQTASRLIGLLQLKSIREAQAEEFTRADHILKMINRLEKLQKPNGGFGWWAASENASPWISLHVHRALAMAGRAGFNILDLAPTRRYLFSQVPVLPVRDQLQILLELAEEGNPPTELEITRIDTFSAPNDYELLAVARLHQLRGDTVDIQRLLDSSQTHFASGRFWGRRGRYFHRQPLDGRLACSLLARRILADSGYVEESNQTINYLLGNSATRNRPGNVPLLGTNTLESAQLLAELIPALLREDEALAPPVVNLSYPGADTTITVFPFNTVVSAESIPQLRIQRSGSGPLPVSYYQRWFDTQPTVKDDDFRLSSRLLDNRDRPLQELSRGTTAYLEVTVEVTADADYVLIEIPIPAGCSYANRSERRGPYAVHREYRRDRVAIFSDRLPKGKYTYRVALEPRFSGKYTLNPARAEMQYLPVVNGNGAMKTIRIE